MLRAPRCRSTLEYFDVGKWQPRSPFTVHLLRRGLPYAGRAKFVGSPDFPSSARRVTAA